MGGGGDSEDNSKCPLCGHTYADKSDNSDHNKHFYEEHFFDHFANPEKTEASGAAAVENTAQKSAVLVDEYRDPRHFEDVPDRRKPFLIKCQYPSLEPCPEEWKSNSYPSIDGLRAKMDAHQKSHVNSDSTSQEPLEKLEPDPWTCKMCLHKRKKRDSQEEEDRTRYSTLSWKNVAANHIEAVHKNIKTLILQPETMWISKKTDEIMKGKKIAWDHGYLKPKYERWEMRICKEMGRTLYEIPPRSIAKKNNSVEDWIEEQDKKKEKAEDEAEDRRKEDLKERKGGTRNTRIGGENLRRGRLSWKRKA